MRIGLYVIGDEILSGKRTDKHLANLANLLQAKGLQLSWVKFLADDLDHLIAEFKQSFDTNDLVFSCGGIGGTPDDLTRLAVAQALNRPLEYHAEGLEILFSREQYFDGGITEQRKRMIEFPQNAKLIPNPINQVPGFSIDHHYFVPGFPKMAEPMMQWVLEHHYPQLNNQHYCEWSLMLFEVPETRIADLMQDLQIEFDVKVFSLPRFVDDGYQVELGLKGDADKVAKAKEKLLAVITEREYSFEE